jgi:hemerythrin
VEALIMKNMLYIVWRDESNLGIPIIDEQHRAIVTTINSLHYFIQEGRGLEALLPTFNILEQYTRIHFYTEEALMERADYTDLDKHIALHEELAKETKRIAREASSDKEPELALKFLKEWWLDHINGEDRHYAEAVKAVLK